ncbi:hypothetical protein HYH02_012518 [Chlamydomonas schloesseri]|uniref:BTB domain-containing protein n=1 Tax=Chlamydomonas schloesseri TaxID=2026947 RepID=A0A835VY49_9CHLO|nr:hypothetical protein HYH02_012518 [Chlamydomonas schloesseri]|eukprot:KAG2433587.1 hypothetical protein HYH02_012518 [Chlamydomonas schloesseri]
MGINTASGLLRLDGTLLVRVELELTQPPAAAPSRWLLSNSQTREYPETLSTNLWGNDVGKDFLSLLTNPGATADLTIIATAAAGAAAGGETAEGGKARRGKKRKAAAAAGSSKGRRRGAAAAGAAGAAAGAAGATAGATAGASSRRFPVHRAVLAARCPYFATHFASGMADSSTSELHMPDTDPDALAALLRFVYGGELPLSSRHHARCCFELADRLLLPKAVALLGQHLVTTPTAATMAADLAWAMRLGGGSQAGPQQGGGPGGAGGSGGAGGGGSGGAGGAGGGSGGGISNNDLVTGLIEFIAEQQEEDLPEEQVRALAAEQPDLMLQLYAAARRAARRSVS